MENIKIQDLKDFNSKILELKVSKEDQKYKSLIELKLKKFANSKTNRIIISKIAIILTKIFPREEIYFENIFRAVLIIINNKYYTLEEFLKLDLDSIPSDSQVRVGFQYILEDNSLNSKKITGTGFEHYTKCSKCQKLIPPEEPYTETIISKEILCSECDKGILDEGDIFLAIN